MIYLSVCNLPSASSLILTHGDQSNVSRHKATTTQFDSCHICVSWPRKLLSAWLAAVAHLKSLLLLSWDICSGPLRAAPSVRPFRRPDLSDFHYPLPIYRGRICGASQLCTSSYQPNRVLIPRTILCSACSSTTDFSVASILMSAVSTFPQNRSKVLCGIFEAVLGSIQDGPEHYVQDRAVLSLVCARWTQVINGHSAFWSHVVVRSRIPIPSLELWVRRAAKAAMTIELLFDITAFRRSHNQDSAVRIYASEVLHIVLEVAVQWHVLSVHANDSMCARWVMDILAGRHALNLVEFTFASPDLTGVFVNLDTSCCYPFRPPQSFGRFPSVRRLSLTATSLVWSNHPCLVRLQTLQLGRFPVTEYPSLTQYVHILSRSARLTRLSLSAMGCNDLRLHSGARVFMPALKELELEFNGIPTMGALVGHFHVPILHTLVLRFHVREDVLHASQCFLGDRRLFASVERLALIGCPGLPGPEEFTFQAASQIVPFFRFLPNIRFVDFQEAHHVFFRHFLRTVATYHLGGSLTPWPSALCALQTICVADSPIQSVESFIKVWSGGDRRCPLNIIMCLSRVAEASGGVYKKELEFLHANAHIIIV